MHGPSEADLRRLFERAPLGMYRSTIDGRFTYVNPAFVRMLGYDSAAEVMQLDISRDIYVDPADRRRLLAQYEADDVVSGVDLRWKTREGATLMVCVYGGVLRDELGAMVGFEVTVLDVTAHRAADEALRRQQAELAGSERKLRMLLDSMPALIWTFDRELRLLSTEGSGLSAIGLGPDTLVGTRLPEYLNAVVGEGNPALDDHRTVLAGNVVHREFTWLGLVYSASISPVRDDDGAVVGGMGIAIDVSDLRRMAARVEHAARVESLGILAGGIAHDFNNLLVAMLGNADLAMREVAATSPARAALRNIKIAGQRAAELTNQLLAYAGKGQFDVREVHVNQVIGELAEILRVSLSKHATLLVDLEPGLATVRADPSQVRQIVLNLITNASDALTDRSGSIIVRTSLLRLDAAGAAAFDVTAELSPGAYVSIEISDTGCGIDEVTRRRIFDPFFTTKSSGHGLGLAAVLGIVRAHHGAIRVLSEPERGATFEVLLPASGAAASVSAGDVVGRGAAPARRTITVMVVDDDDMVSNVLCRMLEELGCETVAVGDGATALAVFDAGRHIDLLFLDLAMPHMSGVEVLRRVHLARPKLPIVVCSGYEDAPVPDTGVAGFVRKPFHLETLESALQLIER